MDDEDDEDGEDDEGDEDDFSDNDSYNANENSNGDDNDEDADNEIGYGNIFEDNVEINDAEFFDTDNDETGEQSNDDDGDMDDPTQNVGALSSSDILKMVEAFRIRHNLPWRGVEDLNLLINNILGSDKMPTTSYL